MREQPHPSPIPVALSIAGSDSSGGAGLQADLKTFSAFGVYGATAVTALTAQNTLGVGGVWAVAPSFVTAQITAVLSDLDVGAIKTGMLASAGTVEAVAQALRFAAPRPLIVDPVMVASSGEALLGPGAVEAIKAELLPLATLLTPNRPEAARLLAAGEAASEADAVAQAEALRALGCRAVLLKGGHAGGAVALDILADDSGIHRFIRPMLKTCHGHGTGCTLSAAICALLAQGVGLRQAVERAKGFVWQALEAGRSLSLGHGQGPVDHLFAIRRGLYPPA